jgi:hypothetical protein
MLSQSLIQSEISEVENKIKALDLIREQLERDLLKIQEDELELDAERMSTCCLVHVSQFTIHQSKAFRNA